MDFFAFALVSASFVSVWKKMLVDIPSLARVVHSLPWIVQKPLTCGFCLGYWVSLGLLICFPGPFSLFNRMYSAEFIPSGIGTALRWFCVWLGLGFASWMLYAPLRLVYWAMEALSRGVNNK